MNYCNTKYTIHTDKLKRSISILFLSDIHNEYQKERFSYSNTPHYILIAGDYVLAKLLKGRLYEEPWDVSNSEVCELFKRLTDIAPVYCSLGNHEWLLSDKDFSDIRSMGVTILDNEYVRLADDLVVGGLTSGIVSGWRKYMKNNKKEMIRGENEHVFFDHFWMDTKLRVPDVDWIDNFEKEEGYRILLSHHPEYWKSAGLEHRNIDLTLSGHAHGGQIRLFNQGLFAPGQGLMPRFTKGMYGNKGEHCMIVSAGMSNPYKMPRLFNPKEIIEIEIL